MIVVQKKLRLKNWVKVFIVLIFILISILCIIMLIPKKSNNKEKEIDIPKKVENRPEKTEEKAELSMVMVGDCLIHKMVYQDALIGNNTYSFDKMFEDIKPYIEGKDLAYYNQESIIGGKSLGLSAYPRFNSPEEIGDDMTNLGFNLVSLVNNHTMDKGEKGVENSVNYWRTKPGVYWTGQALSEEERKNNIKVKKLNGINYGFLAYTTVTNGLLPPTNKTYLTNIYSEEKVKKDIEELKKQNVDLIIVSMHWGEEYQNSENSKQKEIATYLSSLGVNIIIGAHPHVIQPVEMINNTLVFYSLGNFISAQDTDDKLTGALASLIVKKEDNKIVFDDIKVNLIYTSFKYSKPYNFKLYPYEKIDNNILKNHLNYYNKYKKILTKYNVNLEVK